MVDIIYDVLQPAGMPVVHAYFNLRENTFLNTCSDVPSHPLERVGNFCLTPARYLLGGSKKITHFDPVRHTVETQWEFKGKDHPALTVLKTVLSISALIPLTIIGCAFKGLSLLFSPLRQKLNACKTAMTFQESDQNALKLNKKHYQDIGIKLEAQEEIRYASTGEKEHANCQNISKSLQKSIEKEKKIVEELKDFVKVLQEAQVAFWADWGTCLGIYRHNGFIPKDKDVDFSILADDHDSVLKLLKTRLPKDKYKVMDFSPASNRASLIKVELLASGMLVDLYHYEIDEEKKTISYNFSHRHEPFIPAEARKREIPATELLTPFDTVFPLRKASFEGLDVYVPNQIEKWLQTNYGEDLTPCKKFDAEAGDYVKDRDHPYWQQSSMNY